MAAVYYTTIPFEPNRANRGGSRGRVQGVRTPPPPRDDLLFSNTTGILQKKNKLCGLLVLKPVSRARDECTPS